MKKCKVIVRKTTTQDLTVTLEVADNATIHEMKCLAVESAANGEAYNPPVNTTYNSIPTYDYDAMFIVDC